MRLAAKKVGRPSGSHSGKYQKCFGKVQSRMYRKYQSMIARCYQESHPANGHYKSKGITVCERWLGKQGFDNFMDDMGHCPPGLTLERKDNKKGYSPDNCCWATWAEQAKNRTQGGHKNKDPNSLRSKAENAGLPYHVVYQRVKLLGWSEEKALSTPKHERGKWPRQLGPQTPIQPHPRL